MQKESRVYLIEGAGLVKIGVSTDVAGRFRTLEAESPVKLKLLASGPGTITDERALHEHFKEQRDHNEWFKLSKEQIDEVKAIWDSKDQIRRTINTRKSRQGASNPDPEHAVVCRVCKQSFKSEHAYMVHYKMEHG